MVSAVSFLFISGERIPFFRVGRSLLLTCFSTMQFVSSLSVPNRMAEGMFAQIMPWCNAQKLPDHDAHGSGKIIPNDCDDVEDIYGHEERRNLCCAICLIG